MNTRLYALEQWLASFQEHQPHIREYVWLPDSGFYSPPGLYYFPQNGPGHPDAFYGPPPFHPLEVILAEAHGSRITPSGGITSERLLAATTLIRGYPDWLSATAACAKLLCWPLDFTRFAYHILTPLVVNAGGPEESHILDLRTRLYAAAGIQGAFGAAWKVQSQKDGLGGDAPRREFRKFWGNECHWPLRGE